MFTITKAEKSYFRAAKAVSELSDHPVRMGCVVVLGHRIIGSGCNSKTKCSSTQAKLDRKRYGVYTPGHVHCEIAALDYLFKNNINLRRAEIYVYRQYKNGNTGEVYTSTTAYLQTVGSQNGQEDREYTIHCEHEN